MDEEDSTFIRILAIDPAHRSPQENAAIFGYLRTIESLNVPCLSSTYRDTELRAISRYARYRRVPGDVLLYHTGEWCDSWFILINGSVLIESSMFLPRACFGTRANGNFYRRNDCLVLEPSDLVVIDYLDNDSLPVSFTDTHRQAVAPYKHRHSLDRTPVSISCIASHEISSNGHYSASSAASLNTPSLFNSDQDKHLRRTMKTTQKADGIDSFKSSHLSDTSSTHSVSSGGVQNDSSHGRSSHLCVSTKPEKRNQKQSNSYPKWCKTGSDTSHCVDSDDEGDDDEEEDDDEDLESSSHESIRDAFWESILKLPVDRTQEDIDLLLENVEQLPAFSNLTKATRRSLCSVMVLAIVREAGQIVLNDNEKLDTWSVVLNGTVEVIELDGTIRELTRGDAFGVRPGKTDRVHRGIMRTVTEDCYFLCVPQTDYVKIMSREGEAEIPEMGEGGRVVLVYETIDLDSNLIIDLNKSSSDNNTMLKKCRLVTKGTPEKLIEHLIADLSNVDITYPEDFLLTYRTFLDSPRPIVDRLLSWHLHNPKLRPRVNRIILLWVHNHFNDFEDSHEMMKCIEKFDNMLSTDGTAGERRLFRLACSTKARPRQVELAIPLKSSRDLNNSDNKSLVGGGGESGEQHLNNNYVTTNSLIDLPFTIIGGEDGFGVFIHQVYNLTPYNNSGTETYDAIMNQKYLTNPSLSSSSCDSGYPSSPSASSSTCVHPYYSSVHNNQIRRADQLISINGRSVEHLKLSEVIQLIHSMINACCSLDNKTGSNSKLMITGTSGSASPSVTCNSADIANATALNLSKSSTSSSVADATFNLRLLVIFNPVQYYQVINSLNTAPTPLASVKLISKANSYHTTDDMKNQVKKSSAPSSTPTNNYNDNNEICRLKKHSLPLVTICSPMLTTASDESEYACHSKNLQSLELSTPTSISIPDDLVITLNDHQHQQQSSTSVLLPTKPSLESFSTVNALSVSPPNNHSLGRRQNLKSLPHASANRSTHSASTSPSRLSYPHEDSQEFYKTTTTALASNKQSIPFHSHSTKNPVVIDNQNYINHNDNSPSRPYELHSSTDKLNNNITTVDHCFTSQLQRSSSQPDLITLNEPLTVGVNEHPTVLPQNHNHHLTNGFDCLSLNSGNNIHNDNLSVIRVWRSSDNGKDHCSKLILLPRRQTSAFEATRLCIEEFGIPDEDQNSYCLYHVTVECGPIVKQSRLANTLDDLAGRLTLNSRYYLKNLHNHDPLITDDVAKSILAESRVTFTQLPPEELAVRLTIDDYEIFRAVQSTEYIDEVFGLSNSTCINNVSSPVTGNNSNSGYATGHENLDRFTDLVNREAYWAPTEICHETSLNRRVNLLKRFIKLAKLCRELRNFNTMFCLLVGLHQTPVERLKQTWDRLPNKYQKIYRDLSMVLDTSRNFHHYRTLISGDNISAPMLPYLPLVLKDLTFIHLGNPSFTPDGLINFVKLRMLAKEVRVICRMCNVDYDLSLTTHRGRLGGSGGVSVGRTRTGVNLSAVKAVAAVSSINPKSYFLSLTSSMNNSQTNHNNNCPGTDSNWSEHDMVEVKFNHSNSLDDNKQQREVKPNLDVKPINSSNVSGTNVGHKRFHQHGSSATSPSGNFNVGLPTPTSFMIPSSGSGIRRRSNLGLISSSVNPKKIYESWLMTLRIRTYLANLKVVQDPKRLSQLSSQLEPSCKDSKTSHPLASFSVGNTGDTPATSTTTITTNTNERNDSQQLDIPAVPSANNITVVKGLKQPPANTPTQSVASEPNTNKKSLLKIINVSTESSRISVSESTTTSNSLPANSTAVLTRPILGAQSVEDARKLLALSESSKRSSQRRLPAFTFPNHHYHNSNNPNTNSIFITPPVGPSAGIGFGQLKSQHNNSSNVSSVGQPHQAHNNPMIQISNNNTLISSSMPNTIISTCSNHLYHNLHYHHYSHAQNRYPQPARCYFTSSGTISNKSLLLDNLIPMPSRITGTTTLVTTNTNNNVNINSTSNQIYDVAPNQKHPSHLHPQHPVVHHQKISASPPHNRSQSTKKHQYSNQMVNHQNTNYQYHQQQNLQCRSNYIGPHPTLDPNAVPMLHPACRGISPQQQASFPYWHVNSSGGGTYPTNQQQESVHPTRFKDQPSLQQRQQQGQHSAPFNSDENYLYPTANTHPLGGLMLSMPRHYRQSTIQRIIPQHLNSKPTRPPPYEIALALKYPQNANLQRVHQSLKNDLVNTRNENTNIVTNNNNNRTSTNLSPGCKQGPVGHVSMAQGYTQVQTPKLNKQLFNTKQQIPPNPTFSTPTLTTNTSLPAANTHNGNNNNLQSRPSERNKASTVCQLSQQQVQERPSPPSYQQVLSMTRQGNNQGSLKIIAAQSQPSNGRPQPPQRTIAALSSNCNHNNYRASSASPGITIVRPILNDPNTGEPRQTHRSTQKTTLQ